LAAGDGEAAVHGELTPTEPTAAESTILDMEDLLGFKGDKNDVRTLIVQPSKILTYRETLEERVKARYSRILLQS
jgi:hypothetical protein